MNQPITWIFPVFAGWNYLQNTKKAVLVVSHDRHFLDQVTTKTWELEEGALIEYPGNYSRFRVLKSSLGGADQKLRAAAKEVQRLKVMIRRFRQWGHEGDNESFFKKPKIGTPPSETYTGQTAQRPRKIGCKANGGKSGKEVFIVRDLHQQYADQLLFKDSSFAIYRGSI